MFITNEELCSVAHDWQLQQITNDESIVKQAILTAISEAEGYLSGRFDTQAIFSASGDERHVLLVEHIKSIAMWYLMRLSNCDINYERIHDFYMSAKEWLKQVAGHDDKTITPTGLPPKKNEIGEDISSIKMGSRRKFDHEY